LPDSLSAAAGSKSPAVTAAAVVAIIGSLLVFLLAALGLLGVALQGIVPNPNVTPAGSPAAGYLGVAIIAACGGWGLASGIGLLRYRDWARTSTLVWSGITLVFGSIVFLATLTIKIPVPPNAPPQTTLLARLFIALFFGLPAAVAIWWLILFSQKSIRQLFDALSAPPKGPLDESGFPITAPRTRIPVPIAVVAWVHIGSGVLALFFWHFHQSRLLLLGHIFRGPTAAAMTVAFCVVAFVGGVGLLRRRLWAFWLTVCYESFVIVSGTISLLSPERLVLRKEITASYELKPRHVILPDQFFDAIAFLTLLMSAAFLVILLYYRPSPLAHDSNTSTGSGTWGD
jgi:hypothetical protein